MAESNEVMRSGMGVWPRVMKRENQGLCYDREKEREKQRSVWRRERKREKKMGRKGTWAQ
jgi:hypothetical protein